MRPHNFLVIGHPRGCTGFMSQLLSACGHTCGHERRDMPSNSDWTAIINKEYINLPHTQIIHVIRNPIDTITSNILTCADESKNVMFRHIFDKDITRKERLDEYIELYCLWHEECSKYADYTLKGDDPVSVTQFLKDYSMTIKTALKLTTKVNSRTHNRIDELSWLTSRQKYVIQLMDFCAKYEYYPKGI